MACVLLTDRYLGNRGAAHDEEAADVAILEEVNLCAILDGTSNLAAPVGVAESLYELFSHGRSGVGVCFVVVSRRKVKVCRHSGG